jgi:hypothetical protein
VEGPIEVINQQLLSVWHEIAREMRLASFYETTQRYLRCKGRRNTIEWEVDIRARRIQRCELFVLNGKMVYVNGTECAIDCNQEGDYLTRIYPPNQIFLASRADNINIDCENFTNKILNPKNGAFRIRLPCDCNTGNSELNFESADYDIRGISLLEKQFDRMKHLNCIWTLVKKYSGWLNR